MNNQPNISNTSVDVRRYVPIFLAALSAGFFASAVKTAYGIGFYTFLSLGVIMLIVAVVMYAVKNHPKRILDAEYFKGAVSKSVLPFLLLSVVLAVLIFLITTPASKKIARTAGLLKERAKDTMVVANSGEEVSGALKFFVECVDSAIVSYQFDISPIGKNSIDDYIFQVSMSTDIVIMGKLTTILPYNSVEYIKFQFDLYNSSNQKLVSLRDSTNDPQLKMQLAEGCGVYNTDCVGFSVPVVGNEQKIGNMIDTLAMASKFKLSVFN